MTRPILVPQGLPVVVFLGAPGSGKGTQALQLAAAKKWRHIAPGDLLREAVRRKDPIGVKARAHLDAGTLVPDLLVIELLKREMQERAPQGHSGGVVLDGFPRTLAQAEALDTLLAQGSWGKPLVILLQSNREEVIKRLSGRRTCPSGHVFNIFTAPPKQDGFCDVCGARLTGRSDDNAETVAVRYDTYEISTRPLTAFYEKRGQLAAVDGTQSVDKVQQQIVSVIKEKRSW